MCVGLVGFVVVGWWIGVGGGVGCGCWVGG